MLNYYVCSSQTEEKKLLNYNDLVNLFLFGDRINYSGRFFLSKSQPWSDWQKYYAGNTRRNFSN